MGMSEYVAVADVDQVPSDRGLSVSVGDRELALFNLGGQFYALDGFCPHRGGPLGEGITENGRVCCRLLGWEVDVKSGACINNPAQHVACVPARGMDGEAE